MAVTDLSNYANARFESGPNIYDMGPGTPVEWVQRELTGTTAASLSDVMILLQERLNNFLNARRALGLSFNSSPTPGFPPVPWFSEENPIQGDWSYPAPSVYEEVAGDPGKEVLSGFAWMGTPYSEDVGSLATKAWPGFDPSAGPGVYPESEMGGSYSGPWNSAYRQWMSAHGGYCWGIHVDIETSGTDPDFTTYPDDPPTPGSISSWLVRFQVAVYRDLQQPM